MNCSYFSPYIKKILTLSSNILKNAFIFNFLVYIFRDLFT